MDLSTVIGFGVAVSVPVWLVVEEIANRRGARMARPAERKAGVRIQRPTGSSKRPAPAVRREAVSRLSASA